MASQTEEGWVGRVNLLAVRRSNIVQDASEGSFASGALQLDLTPLGETMITKEVAALQLRFIRMRSQTYGALAVVVIESLAETGCGDRCIVITHHACNIVIPTRNRRRRCIYIAARPAASVSKHVCRVFYRLL